MSEFLEPAMRLARPASAYHTSITHLMLDFTRIDLWIVVVYLLAMLLIGFLVSFKSRDVEGYTVGNRSMSGWVVGLSVLGTFLSSITFLGLPAATYDGNWSSYVFGMAL